MPAQRGLQEQILLPAPEDGAGKGAEAMTTEKRLARLNRLGQDLDERAASMHPSAWPEALKEDMERWKRLARKL